MKKSILMKNTLIILITGFVVKIIGMLGKIFTTRILGLSGMSLYVLSYPTLLLFVSISGFSMNNTISKLVSEGVATKKYSPKLLLIKGIKLSLLISIICLIIYLLTIKSISIYMLKNEDLYIPLLSGVFLIPLVGASDALRGYFNGLKKIPIASTSLFIEQIFRTTSSILGVYFGIKHNIILANSLLFIGLAIGEIASITYCLIKIKKEKLIHYENTKNETTILFKTSSTLTFSRLIGSISYFLEPIVYTFILTYLNYKTELIHETYTMIDAYSIPLLTMVSFIPFALSTAIIPHISESYAKKDYSSLNNYINKAYFFTIYPASFCLLFIYFFDNELMLFIYNTNTGADIAKSFSLIFIFYYISAITNSILQAMGKIKVLFLNSILINCLRLILIVIMSYFIQIGPLSIMYAIIISIIISSIVLFFILLKNTNLTISINTIIKYIIVLLFIYSLLNLLNQFNLNFILSAFISGLLFLLIFIMILKKKL